MKKRQPKLCRWCGLVTNRHCGICLDCCEKRDAHDKLIDEGKAKYIPPTERPRHRFYERKQLNEAQLTSLAKANAAKNAVLARRKAQG